MVGVMVRGDKASGHSPGLSSIPALSQNSERSPSLCPIPNIKPLPPLLASPASALPEPHTALFALWPPFTQKHPLTVTTHVGGGEATKCVSS